jgi:hypothetical protein
MEYGRFEVFCVSFGSSGAASASLLFFAAFFPMEPLQQRLPYKIQMNKNPVSPLPHDQLEGAMRTQVKASAAQRYPELATFTGCTLLNLLQNYLGQLTSWERDVLAMMVFLLRLQLAPFPPATKCSGQTLKLSESHVDSVL